jgi:hypothetical protein
MLRRCSIESRPAQRLSQLRFYFHLHTYYILGGSTEFYCYFESNFAVLRSELLLIILEDPDSIIGYDMRYEKYLARRFKIMTFIIVNCI